MFVRLGRLAVRSIESEDECVNETLAIFSATCDVPRACFGYSPQELFFGSTRVTFGGVHESYK